MKAIRIHARGGPEQLTYEDAPKPIPHGADALVRVKASAVTPTELGWSTAYTTADGVDRLPAIPGHEFSGIVDAVGPDAEGVAIGEAVYGLTDFFRDGSDAEYIVTAAADLAPKPETLNFAEAAAVPLSGLTAWQALFDHGMLGPGQRVLIHGAAGGVGTFAVQFAHWCGAFVAGTASASNAPYLRSLGADVTIDYRAVRFEDAVRDIDVVLDTIGGETLERTWPVVKRGGIIVTIAGEISPKRADDAGVRGVSFIVKPDRKELIRIGQLIDERHVRPVVTAVYPLSQARQAFERGADGHMRGKVVLTVEGEDAQSAGVKHWAED
jgi:NADPH:quinone reductase-like Zn-dependent oxidoreductase